jgi:GntR family transcriptional regulator / MocR family aminotransferase
VSLKLDGDGPLNRQVYRAIRTAIERGVLEHGERLWSSRLMQQRFAVSRNVILMALTQLIAEGHLEARRGAGTFVNARAAGLVSVRQAASLRQWPVDGVGAALSVQPGFDIGGAQAQFVGREFRYDFRYARTYVPPATLMDWTRLDRRDNRSAFERCHATGHPDLKHAVAAYLRRSRGVVADEADILITSGAQEALDLTVRLFASRRATVLVEDPHYRPFSMLAASHGARIHALAVDAQGLDIEGLPKRRCALAYLTPNHQFPCGSVLSVERRQALLNWAERFDTLLIEDDYDGEFRYDSQPLSPLKQLDGAGRVIYIGSMSKVLSPALRLGYAVLPPGLMPRYASLKELSTGGCPARTQKTLARLIQQGLFERHLRRVRRVYAERRAALVAAIDQHLPGVARYQDSCAGVHLMLWLDEVRALHWREFLLHASRLQVAAFAATSLFSKLPRSLPLMLSYGGIETSDIEPGVRLLAQAIGTFTGEPAAAAAARSRRVRTGT